MGKLESSPSGDDDRQAEEQEFNRALQVVMEALDRASPETATILRQVQERLLQPRGQPSPSPEPPKTTSSSLSLGEVKFGNWEQPKIASLPPELLQPVTSKTEKYLGGGGSSSSSSSGPVKFPTATDYADTQQHSDVTVGYLRVRNPMEEHQQQQQLNSNGHPPPVVIEKRYWDTGLFDCTDDPENALKTACCPCWTFGQIAEIVDDGYSSCAMSGLIYSMVCLPCILSCTYRTKLRKRLKLYELPATDCVTHFFCEHCALCQEYRQLRLRGLDPKQGWEGVVAWNALQAQTAITPPTNQRMV